MNLIQKIRRKAAYIVGLSKSEDEAPMNTPRIGIVTSPKDYVSLDGTKLIQTIKTSQLECFRWKRLIKQ